MKLSRWMIATGATLALSMLAAWGAPDSKPATVGDFAYKVAVAMGRQPVNQEAALASFTKKGVDFGKDPGATLTWGWAATILQDFGMKVATPLEPAALVPAARAAQIINTVGVIHGGGQKLTEGHHGHDCPPSPCNPNDCNDGDHGGDHDHGDDHDHGGDDHGGDHHGDDHGDDHHGDDHHNGH